MRRTRKKRGGEDCPKDVAVVANKLETKAKNYTDTNLINMLTFDKFDTEKFADKVGMKSGYLNNLIKASKGEIECFINHTSTQDLLKKMKANGLSITADEYADMKSDDLTAYMIIKYLMDKEKEKQSGGRRRRTKKRKSRRRRRKRTKKKRRRKSRKSRRRRRR